MATIHLVKDGKKANGERVTNSFDIPIDVATKALGKFGTRHSDRPPTINPEKTPTDFALFKHVVLEVKNSETNSSFPEQGYYFIVGLEASECRRLLEHPGPDM